MSRKNIAVLGIITCIAYFVLTLIFVTTGSRKWLTAFEIITMIAGIVMFFIITALPFSQNIKNSYKMMAFVFVTACMILTNTAHIVNLTVTESLLRNGISVPEYLQIGMWPSVEMAIDYLGWGLFMGLAFLFSSFGLVKEKKVKSIKIILIVCGALCLLGFFGVLLINENLWYIAPAGYGIGTFILCIKLLYIEE